MIGPPPQCSTCKHWTPPIARGETDTTLQTCTAYPKGIPDKIWTNRADHRQPQDRDHGIRWEPDGDAQFPEWAMNT